MELHRAKSKPDWELIEKNEFNIWQQLAKASGGLLTPGNGITIIGFSLVIFGLVSVVNHVYWLGAVALVVGRLFDVLDGEVAERTGTKSAFGEFLDASLDKLGTFLSLIVLYLSAVVPWWIMAVLLTPHLIISVIVFLAFLKKEKLHPSEMGKLSMGAVWVSLIGFVALRAMDAGIASAPALMVYGVAALSVGIGIKAALGYARQ